MDNKFKENMVADDEMFDVVGGGKMYSIQYVLDRLEHTYRCSICPNKGKCIDAVKSRIGKQSSISIDCRYFK